MDVNLADLEGRITNGYDFLRNTTNLIDTHGHGTMVSSSIAAVANNGIGIALIFGETGAALVQADSALAELKSRSAWAYVHQHTSLAINLWQLR